VHRFGDPERHAGLARPRHRGRPDPPRQARRCRGPGPGRRRPSGYLPAACDLHGRERSRPRPDHGKGAVMSICLHQRQHSAPKAKST